jgi:hypothetical protein
LPAQEFDVAMIKPSDPPSITYTIGGVSYAQKVSISRRVVDCGSTLRDLIVTRAVAWAGFT